MFQQHISIEQLESLCSRPKPSVPLLEIIQVLCEVNYQTLIHTWYMEDCLMYEIWQLFYYNCQQHQL